jgi:hypothetical protein
MSLEDATQKIKSSAFFPDEPIFIKGCHGTSKKCVGYLIDRKAGLTITVDFEPASDERPETLVASEITLWFGPGAIPYLDPQGMRSNFVRLIGHPDRTIESSPPSDVWGDVEVTGGIPSIIAFADEQTFVVVLSAGHTSETSISIREARR